MPDQSFDWRRRVRAGLVSAVLLGGEPAHADMVTTWNAHLVQAVRTAAQPATVQARFTATVHAAIYDAVNGIARRYTPYHVTEEAPPGAREEAAAAQAAYTALLGLYPSQAETLGAQLAAALASIPGHEGKSVSIERGRAWGEYVAARILAWRSTDGFTGPIAPYFGGSAPGVWRSLPTPTNPDGTLPAAFPQMGALVPFARTDPAGYRPGPPPTLTSPEYARDVNEVMTLGGLTSTGRADQTQLARLWQAVGVVEENEVVQQVVPAGATLVDSARLFALVNIAACDAIIASMDSKFAYGLWRPQHAIRLADTDGNPATTADPTWTALILAPRFPEYVSNHAAVTGAVMRVLTQELGDDHDFTLSSPGLPGASWAFGRFSDAAAQVVEARIWAGIHFRTADERGREVGEKIAADVLESLMQPAHQD